MTKPKRNMEGMMNKVFSEKLPSSLNTRAARALNALREPDSSLRNVANTVRQSMADVLEELMIENHNFLEQRHHDAWLWQAYHQLLKEAGIEPSSADLLAAAKRADMACPYCGTTKNLRIASEGDPCGPDYICEGCFKPSDTGPCFDDLPEADFNPDDFLADACRRADAALAKARGESEE